MSNKTGFRFKDGNLRHNIQNDLSILYCEKGFSSPDIAKMLGCSEPTVLLMLRESGINIRSGSDAHKTKIYCDKFSHINLDINELGRLYLEKGCTIKDIAIKYGCSTTCIRKRMIRHGIARRDKSTALKMPECQAKLKASKQTDERREANRQWNLRRYKDPKERERTGQATKKAYNSDPTLRRRQSIATKKRMENPEIRENAVKKLKEYWKGEEGEAHRALLSARSKMIWQDPEYRAKMKAKHVEIWKRNNYEAMRKMRLACCVHPNKPEKVVINILNELYPSEWKFVGDGEVIIGGLNPDIINVNGKKLIIEVFGDYWHRQGLKPYHVNEGRVKVYAGYGYKTLILWESEIKDASLIRQKISAFANVG